VRWLPEQQQERLYKLRQVQETTDTTTTTDGGDLTLASSALSSAPIARKPALIWSFRLIVTPILNTSPTFNLL
jgi:hypothetical protein